MKNRAVAVCAFVTVAGCAAGGAAVRADVSPVADVRAVESVLRSWYAASERHDSAAYAAAILPEFFILEDTTRYDRSTLLRLVAASFSAGTDHATLSDFSTSVAGDVAWSTFRNDEVFTPTGAAALPVRRFIETAVFRRAGGEWKLARYHATRINRPATAP
jgi:ketosteroid isomerase-like protein